MKLREKQLAEFGLIICADLLCQPFVRGIGVIPDLYLVRVDPRLHDRPVLPQISGTTDCMRPRTRTKIHQSHFV
jgi:hypothetical protein